MKNTAEYKSQICKQYNLTSREYDSLTSNAHYAKSSAENRDTILEIIFAHDEAELERVVTATLKKYYSKLPEK